MCGDFRYGLESFCFVFFGKFSNLWCGFSSIFLLICSIVDQQQNPDEYVNIIVEQVDNAPAEFAFNIPQNIEEDGKKSWKKDIFYMYRMPVNGALTIILFADTFFDCFCP